MKLLRGYELVKVKAEDVEFLDYSDMNRSCQSR